MHRLSFKSGRPPGPNANANANANAARPVPPRTAAQTPLRPARIRPSLLRTNCPEALEINALICERSQLLEDADRALLQLYLDTNWTASRIAAAVGLSPSSVLRRIQIIVERLTSGKFVDCLRHRGLSIAQMRVARDRHLNGLSLRAIADRTGLTVYRVRTELKAIDEILSAP